jgi:Leucine-rich repeat (LRR) protein
MLSLRYSNQNFDTNAASQALRTEPRLKAASYLFLYNNEIERCPVELFALPQLTVLDLSYNRLEFLSDDIALLTNLKV